MTKLQRKYYNQRKRLEKAVTRLRESGYVIPADFLPRTPRRVTQKAVSELEYLTFARLRAKALYYTRQASKLEKWEVALDNVQKLIDDYPLGGYYLNKTLKSEIKKYGAEAVGRALLNAPEESVELVNNILHYQDTKEGIHRSFLEFHGLITGTIRTAKENEDLNTFLDSLEWEEEVRDWDEI